MAALHAENLSFEPSPQAGVVLVGAGPVGMQCAKTICEKGFAGQVTVLGDEPWKPYDRVRLSSFLAREMRHEALFDHQDLSGYPQARVVAQVKVASIDRSDKTVLDTSGRSWPFEKLILATGSTPNVPEIPGRELDAVYVFRSMSDAQALLARQIRSRVTVVIGGGLLGLEAARAMLRFNTEVHVVEHEPRLMFRQLDEKSSAMLQAHVERLGIVVHTGTSVQQIFGRYTPAGIILRNGAEITCDTVVISAGIRPRVELARDAGLAVGRGIRVDDQMRTSDPDIFAIGECCEHRNSIYGLVAPGIEQAAVAANVVLGNPGDYRGSIVATQLKVVGCNVFSMGDVEDSVRPYASYTHESDRGYRRINVYRGRPIGAVGFGEWDVSRLRNLAIERRRLWPWQLLRFRQTGDPWLSPATRVAAWPAGAIVCTCRGVSRGQLSAALERGAATPEALAKCTGASTVCGTCKPLLASLIGTKSEPLAIEIRLLIALSLLMLIGVAVSWFSALPYAERMVLGFRWDEIWTNSLYKQISGFALLALSVVLAVLSLRKRIRRFSLGSFSGWQLAHGAIGLVALLALLVHTGFRPGANLNGWLMSSYSALLFVGAVSGALTGSAERIAPNVGRHVRSAAVWLHIVLLWPLPVLIGFHVLKSYYF